MRRPVLLCARRDSATCGRDSPAPSIHPRPRPTNRGRPAFLTVRRYNPRHLAERITMWDTHNTRKPILLLRLSGLLLRAAERALAALLFDSGVTLRFAKR